VLRTLNAAVYEKDLSRHERISALTYQARMAPSAPCDGIGSAQRHHLSHSLAPSRIRHDVSRGRCVDKPWCNHVKNNSGTGPAHCCVTAIPSAPAVQCIIRVGVEIQANSQPWQQLPLHWLGSQGHARESPRSCPQGVASGRRNLFSMDERATIAAAWTFASKPPTVDPPPPRRRVCFAIVTNELRLPHTCRPLSPSALMQRQRKGGSCSRDGIRGSVRGAPVGVNTI
jgi:hypothetical protein